MHFVNRFISTFLTLLLILCFESGFAEEGSIATTVQDGKKYVSLYDMKSRFSMEASFNIVLQRGRLYSKGHVATYVVGHSVILIDGRLTRDDYSVMRKQGDVLIPLYLAKSIIEAFYPTLKVTETAGFLTTTEKKTEQAGPSEKTEPSKSLSPEPIAFIIIDAGHGGKDPGAVGKGNLREKNITLGIAKHLETELKNRKKLKGIIVYMTRRTDKFLELYERTEAANSKLKKNINGVFVSVHVNASLTPKISGFETYFLSQNPTNEEARNTAALENNVVVFEKNSGKKKYGEIEYIEARMITTQIQRESSMLANAIQKGMSAKMKPFKSRGVRKADFFVLRGSLMPAALVEVGFITNRSEAKYLNRADYQKKLAESIADGISAFIEEYNKTVK